MDLRIIARVFLICLFLFFHGSICHALTGSAEKTMSSPPRGLDKKSWSKIIEKIKHDQYRFNRDSRNPARYFGSNSSHHLSFEITAGKLLVSSGSSMDKWNFLLELTGLGTGEQMIFPAVTGVEKNGTRLDLQRGLLTEWYINNRLGLEQGFTLQAPPWDKAKKIILKLNGSSTLMPRLLADGSGLSFLDSKGNEKFRYSGLKAWDSSSRSLPVRFIARNLHDSIFQVHLEVDVVDAVYPVTIDPVIVEMKKIWAWDAEEEDRFGFSVAISDDTVVVGVPYEDTGGNLAGAAYIFVRDQGGANNWGQVKKLVAWDAEEHDYFGKSVAISGDTVVVGVPGEDTGSISAGAVYIFARNQGGANNWGLVKKLVAWDAEEQDHFGASVAINEDTVVVGVPLEDTGSDNAGAVYIFVRDQGGANNWGQVKKIVAWDAEADDRFGYSVAISGDTVVVGVLYEDTGSNNAGAVYIFVRDQGGANNWGQVKKIVAWDAEADDRFSQSVDISGDTVVVGAPYEDTGSDDAGAAYIFARDQGGANNWGLVKKIWAWDAEAYDRFGYSVAISGDTVVMGVPYEDTGSDDAGAAYIDIVAYIESVERTSPGILLLLMAQ